MIALAPQRMSVVLLAGLMLTVLPLVTPNSVPGASTASAASAADVWTVHRFDTTEPVMVLTFDAGADRGHAGAILDTLAAKGVHGTFGMTGGWAQSNPDLIWRIVNEGHGLINHTWSHPSFPGLTSAQRADELRRTEDLIRNQVGVELQPYFRPPYGEYNDSVLADLAANGYTVNVMWTVDTLGWAGRSAADITSVVLNTAVPGGIVLMHVGAESQDAAALPGMIDQLRARGYRFATVDDLAQASNQERYFPETGHTVTGRFLRYWNRFGGLPVFGYPLTDEMIDPATGLTVQYFERERFEYQPGVWPARYDVLLGLLGNEFTANRRHEAPFQPLSGVGGNANCTFFRETGHWLCWGFRDYWLAHGGLEILGYPISEEFQEDGRTVQYFERARFEWHPENQPPWNVLLAHLGRWALEN
jgi:peptidoglycan/xylan/chitin deacetylase (PgdA/CDA1 family)